MATAIMDISNLTFVSHKGRFVLAQYALYNDYSKGQGVPILEFLRDLANIKRLREGLEHIYVVNDEELEQIQEVDLSIIKPLSTGLEKILHQKSENLGQIENDTQMVMKILGDLKLDQEELDRLIDKLGQRKLRQIEEANKLTIECLLDNLCKLDEKAGSLARGVSNENELSRLIIHRLRRQRERLQHIMSNRQMIEEVYARDSLLTHELAVLIMNVDGLSSRYNSVTLWPSLSYKTGAQILELAAQANAENGMPIQLDLKSVKYCKWAYVVDLDRQVFEVYRRGYDAVQSKENERFNNVGEMGDVVPAFVKSFCFAELPMKEEFITAVNEALMKE